MFRIIYKCKRLLIRRKVMRELIQMIKAILSGSAIVIIKKDNNRYKCVQGKQIDNKFLKGSIIDILSYTKG